MGGLLRGQTRQNLALHRHLPAPLLWPSRSETLRARRRRLSTQVAGEGCGPPCVSLVASVAVVGGEGGSGSRSRRVLRRTDVGVVHRGPASYLDAYAVSRLYFLAMGPSQLLTDAIPMTTLTWVMYH